MLHKFQCPKCKGTQIVVRKWVECRTDVIIDYKTGHIEYGPPVINENEVCGNQVDFICKKCNAPLFYTQLWVHDERELSEYLSHSPEQIARDNDEYLEEEAELHAAQMEYEECQMIED